jgi:hypothetical protein
MVVVHLDASTVQAAMISYKKEEGGRQETTVIGVGTQWNGFLIPNM